MALQTPFIRDSFSSDVKTKFSGGNLTLDYDNFQSALEKVGVEVAALVGLATYNKICDGASTGTEWETAKDYLQRTMLHFSIYGHIIYLIAKIGNDGITEKKSDNETTIYKYHQVELQDQLITDAWFWMNELFKYLNANATTFTEWSSSDEKKEFDALPVTTKDFNKFLGISDDYFVMSSRWIIKEIWDECVLSRVKEPSRVAELVRAVCYETLSRACIRLPYYSLPKTVRNDVNTELSKAHASKSNENVNNKVAAQYEKQAEGYWYAYDTKLAAIQAETPVENVSEEVYTPAGINTNDKFNFTQ